MRLFIGIALPAQVHASLAELTLELASEAPGARWVGEDNFHVTLKFLGQTPEETVPDILASMRRAALEVSPFSLRLDRLGMFPSPKRARVIWLGVTDGFEESVALAGALDRELAPLGYKIESRPYHPHITLARLRDPKPLPQLAAHASEQPPPIDASVSVPRVTLFQSKLMRSGAQYSVVEEVPLGTD